MCVSVCDEMNVSLCLCKRFGLLRDAAPSIIYDDDDDNEDDEDDITIKGFK